MTEEVAVGRNAMAWMVWKDLRVGWLLVGDKEFVKKEAKRSSSAIKWRILIG